MSVPSASLSPRIRRAGGHRRLAGTRPGGLAVIPGAAGPGKAAQRRRWVILGVLITSLMAIVVDNTVLNVAMKTIALPGPTGLGASQGQLEWAINSYTLVFAGLLFTSGVIGDRIGRKRMLMIGLASFGLFSLMTAYAHSPAELIWARAAMGMGAAAVMPQTLSVISNVFDPAERAQAIGIWATAVGIGIAVGPIVGGILLAHFWWGSVFLINVPLTAASVTAIWMLVPESRSPQPGRIDHVGVLASIAGLVLLVYGIIRGGDSGSWVRPDVLGPAAAGVAALAFFAWYEARIGHPSLDVRLFRDPRLSSAVGAIALVFSGMMSRGRCPGRWGSRCSALSWPRPTAASSAPIWARCLRRRRRWPASRSRALSQWPTGSAEPTTS